MDSDPPLAFLGRQAGMKLDNIHLVLTPRRPLEAMDLGLFALYRWRAAVYGPWLFVSLPIVFVLFFALRQAPLWIPLALSLLKPWLARIPLHVLSRGVFGPLPALSTVLVEAPKILGKRPWVALFQQRFSFRRALSMPVDLLEEPKGAQRSKRLRVLGNGDAGGAASSLAFLFSCFEIALGLSTVALCIFFGPASWGQSLVEFSEYGSADTALLWVFTASYTFAVLVLEPALVAAGFGLYLTRRTDLEGWDLELIFRSIAQRLQAKRESNLDHLPKKAAKSALLLLILLTICPSSRAQEQTLHQQDPAAVAQDILSSEAFNTTITRRQWVPPSFGNNNLGKFLGPLMVTGAWIAFAVAVIYLISWLAKKNKPQRSRSRASQSKERPSRAFGLDLRAESLPSDLVQEAQDLWARGQLRAALSLLYRGALACLIDQDGLQIHTSDTEQDCVERVSSLSQSGKAQYFERLTLIWLNSAWGAKPPELSEGPLLCSSWNEHFGGQA